MHTRPTTTYQIKLSSVRSLPSLRHFNVSTFHLLHRDVGESYRYLHSRLIFPDSSAKGSEVAEVEEPQLQREKFCPPHLLHASLSFQMPQSLVDGRPDRHLRENERSAEVEAGETGNKSAEEEGNVFSQSSQSNDRVKELSTGVPTVGGGKDEGSPTKPSKLKQLWEKIGLDLVTVLMMLKYVENSQTPIKGLSLTQTHRGSIAPLIAVAFYQADTVASIYGAIGYLVPIVTVLSVTIMPRAKFLQTMILNTIGICSGSVRILPISSHRSQKLIVIVENRPSHFSEYGPLFKLENTALIWDLGATTPPNRQYVVFGCLPTSGLPIRSEPNCQPFSSRSSCSASSRM